MGEIFNVDNKFFQSIGKIIDCVCVSVLWLVFCLPVFTAGAATTALYYTINKVIRYNRGYILREFWHAFRTNFKQSTLLGLLFLAMELFFGMDCYIMYQFAAAGDKAGSIYPLFVVFMALVVAWGIYLFPYIARFENTTKQALKNSGLIALGNLPWTVLLFVILCVAIVGVMYLPPMMFILPAAYMLIANLILEKIFRKYMSEEDIAAEEERNRDFYN